MALFDWPLSLLDKIADLPNVIAIKEDAEKDEYTSEVTNLLCDRLAIITSGNGMKQWLKFSDSAQAWLSGVGGFNPVVEIDFYEAWKNNDLRFCHSIINDVEIPFDKIKDRYGWHLGIKSAMHIAGVMNRQERMPLQELPKKDFKQLERMMIDMSSQSSYFNLGRDR